MVELIEKLCHSLLYLLEAYLFGDGDEERLLVIEKQKPFMDFAILVVRLLLDVVRDSCLILHLLENGLRLQSHSRGRFSAEVHSQLF